MAINRFGKGCDASLAHPRRRPVDGGALLSKMHSRDSCGALTDGSSIMQNTLITTHRHVFRITVFTSGV